MDLDNKATFQDLELMNCDISSIKNELSDVIKTDLEAQKKTLAESVFHQVDTKIETVHDKIIEAKLAESMEEVRDRDARKTNVVVFGLEESDSIETDIRIEHDKNKIDNLLTSIKGDLLIPKVKKMIRLGKPAMKEERAHGKKPRPLKVLLTDETSKNEFLEKARNLRRIPNNIVFIAPDLSQKERAERKILVAERDQLGPIHSRS